MLYCCHCRYCSINIYIWSSIFGLAGVWCCYTFLCLLLSFYVERVCYNFIFFSIFQLFVICYFIIWATIYRECYNIYMCFCHFNSLTLPHRWISFVIRLKVFLLCENFAARNICAGKCNFPLSTALDIIESNGKWINIDTRYFVL